MGQKRPQFGEFIIQTVLTPPAVGYFFLSVLGEGGVERRAGWRGEAALCISFPSNDVLLTRSTLYLPQT